MPIAANVRRYYFPGVTHGGSTVGGISLDGDKPWPGAPVPDGKIDKLLDYDFGAGVNYPDLSGVITVQPPTVRRQIPSLVPRVDSDGNETGGGVPSVQHLVPEKCV